MSWSFSVIPVHVRHSVSLEKLHKNIKIYSFLSVANFLVFSKTRLLLTKPSAMRSTLRVVPGYRRRSSSWFASAWRRSRRIASRGRRRSSSPSSYQPPGRGSTGRGSRRRHLRGGGTRTDDIINNVETQKLYKHFKQLESIQSIKDKRHASF